jgi:hypothetical protein
LRSPLLHFSSSVLAFLIGFELLLSNISPSVRKNFRLSPEAAFVPHTNFLCRNTVPLPHFPGLLNET